MHEEGSGHGTGPSISLERKMKQCLGLCMCKAQGARTTVATLGDTSPDWAPADAFIPSVGAAELEDPREAVGTREPPCSLPPAPVPCTLPPRWLHPCSSWLGSLPGRTALAAAAGLAARQSRARRLRWCDVQALRQRCVQPAELRGCPRLTCICSGTYGPLSGDFSWLGLVIFHTG